MDHSNSESPRESVSSDYLKRILMPDHTTSKTMIHPACSWSLNFDSWTKCFGTGSSKTPKQKTCWFKIFKVVLLLAVVSLHQHKSAGKLDHWGFCNINNYHNFVSIKTTMIHRTHNVLLYNINRNRRLWFWNKRHSKKDLHHRINHNPAPHR